MRSSDNVKYRGKRGLSVVPIEEAVGLARRESAIDISKNRSNFPNTGNKPKDNGSSVDEESERKNAQFSVRNGHSLSIRTGNKSLLAPIEGGLKILPSDESFKWSNDNYNQTQRNIDVWSFVLTLRLRLYLIDAKWSYVGGFSEEKQVSSSLYL